MARTIAATSLLVSRSRIASTCAEVCGRELTPSRCASPQDVGAVVGEASQQRAGVDQLNASLRHPVSREVADVLREQQVGVGSQRGGEDMPVLVVHLHLSDPRLVASLDFNQG